MSTHTPYGEPRAPSSRFLPPDPGVEAPYRLTPGLAFRVGILGIVALAVFAVLFFRLWSLQVLSGDTYLAAAQGNQLRTIRLEAPRGTILDRHGRVIVDNVAGTAVKLWVGDLPRNRRYAVIKHLADVLNVPPLQLAKEVDERIGDPLNPITVKTAVGEDQVAYLYEHSSEFPGVQIQQTYLRHYPYQSLAAQVLGYVGEVSQGELDQKPSVYRPGDKVGKTGVESRDDEYLRGDAGQAEIRVDSMGRPQGPLQLRREARPGKAVRLTIDVGLQRAAEQALRYGITTARANESYYADGGAIVALDPNDGAVLAMASSPTYKPSVYVGRVDPKKIEPLVNDKVAKEKNYPGINRVTSGVYPPGSTWKPVTALAAMQEHMLQPYQALQCTPTATYGLDKQEFRNWDPYVNQPMTLVEALARSCDTYFYQLGYQFYLEGDRGRNRMQQWARKFGFGVPTGFDLGGEQQGLVPTPAWRKKAFKGDWDRAWNPGNSIQLSIGQQDVQVTPLQMARFYAMIANGGKLVTPYVVSQVETAAPNGQSPVVERRFAPDPPKAVGVDPAALNGRPRRPLLGGALDVRDVVRRVLELPDPDRRQDRNGREGRPAARVPGGAHRGSVLVVRLRAGADRGAAHRRLRRDRERRPRVDRGRAGGAAGLREVLRREGREPDPGEHRLMIVDAGRQRIPLRRDAVDLAALVRRLDLVLLLAAAALVGYGLWAVAGITRFDVPGDPGYYVTRQAIAAALGGVGLVVAIAIPPSLYRRHWRVVYGVAIGLMVVVFGFAEAVRGSKRWIDIGPLQFQPSEFGKVLFVLAIAGFLVERQRDLGRLRTVALALALGAAPMLLVFLQPDLGTALVYAAAFSAVLFVAGVRWLHLALLGTLAATLVLGVLWFLPASGIDVLKPYQTARLTGFANPDADPSGLTYNVTQSITAVGSGGIDGRGVDEASQTRFDYLPEHATDFVFASFAEQRGFFGTAILLLLYLLVVWRGLRVVTVAGDLYGAVVAGGLVFGFLFQVFVNVGMTMGIAPVTGIPLPFVTVGGSSMVANLVAVGVLQGIHARGRTELR